MFVVVSSLTQKSHPAKELLDMEGKPMSRREMLGILPVFASDKETTGKEEEAS